MGTVPRRCIPSPTSRVVAPTGGTAAAEDRSSSKWPAVIHDLSWMADHPHQRAAGRPARSIRPARRSLRQGPGDPRFPTAPWCSTRMGLSPTSWEKEPRVVVARGGRGGRGNAAARQPRATACPGSPSPVRQGRPSASRSSCGPWPISGSWAPERRQVHAALPTHGRPRRRSPTIPSRRSRRTSASPRPGGRPVGRRRPRVRSRARIARGGASDIGSSSTSSGVARWCSSSISRRRPGRGPRRPSHGAREPTTRRSSPGRRSSWARRRTWSTIRRRPLPTLASRRARGLRDHRGGTRRAPRARERPRERGRRLRARAEHARRAPSRPAAVRGQAR